MSSTYISIGYVSLEDFTLQFPTIEPGVFLDIPVKSSQIFYFVSLDWMNWIRVVGQSPEKIYNLETGSPQDHLFRLENEKKCIKLEDFKRYKRDKQISKILD